MGLHPEDILQVSFAISEFMDLDKQRITHNALLLALVFMCATAA